MSADFLVNGQVQIASPSKQNLDRINRDIKSALNNIQTNVRLGFDKKDMRAQLKQTLAGIKVELPIQVKADLGSLAKLQANINRQLAQISPTVYVKVKAQEAKSLAQGIDRGQVGKIVGANNSVVSSNKKVVDSFDSIGRQIGIAIRRYGTFTVATTAFIKLTRSFGTAIKQAIDFDRELVRLAQVSNTTVANIRPIADEVRRLAVGMGASSEELIKASNTFLQAGLSLKDTKILLESLAKTTLSATFIDPENTKEAIIAIRQQFGIAVKDMDKVLSSINAVAAAFASESEDITTAVRRAGAAVKTSGATFDEFQASVVAVRQTTRESAETIATGLRTIALRLQRVKTQEFLRKFGIELLDTQGNFVGFVKAIDKLRQGLSGLAENSPEYAKIVEEVAGYRQVSKLLPLIQKYDVLLKAIQVSERGALSLTRDSMKAQDALSVQLNKVKEAYLELAFAVADNKGFRELVKVFSDLAVSLAAVGTSIAKSNLLPAIVALGGLSLLKSGVFTRLASGVMGGLKSATVGLPITRNSGGGVPGKGNTDTVPAMLTPGEYVLNKDMVSQVGTSALERWRKAGVPPQKFSRGGGVKGINKAKKKALGKVAPATYEELVALKSADIDANTELISSLSEGTLGLNIYAATKRKRKKHEEAERFKKVRKLTSQPLPVPLKLYSGLDELSSEAVLAAIQNEDKTFSLPRFLSTSTSKKTADYFARNGGESVRYNKDNSYISRQVLLEIDSFEGQPGFPILSSYEMSKKSLGEKEVLLPNNSSFKILNSDIEYGEDDFGKRRELNKIRVQRLNFGGSVRQLSRKDKQIYERLTDANKVLKNKYGITTKDIVGDKIFVGKRKGFLGEYDSEFNAMFLDSNTGIDTIFEESFHGVDNILGGGNIYQWASHEQGTLPNKIASLFGQNKQDFAKTLGFDFKKHQQYFSNPMEMFAKPLAMRLSSPQKARKINNVSSSFDMYEGLYDERLTDLIHDKVKGFQKFNGGGEVFRKVTDTDTRLKDSILSAEDTFLKRTGVPLSQWYKKNFWTADDPSKMSYEGGRLARGMYSQSGIDNLPKDSIYLKIDPTSTNTGSSTVMEEVLHYLDRDRNTLNDYRTTTKQSPAYNMVTGFRNANPTWLKNLLSNERYPAADTYINYVSRNQETFAKVFKRFLTTDTNSQSKGAIGRYQRKDKNFLDMMKNYGAGFFESVANDMNIKGLNVDFSHVDKRALFTPKGFRNDSKAGMRLPKASKNHRFGKLFINPVLGPTGKFGFSKSQDVAIKPFSNELDNRKNAIQEIKNVVTKTTSPIIPPQLPVGGAFVPQPWHYDETGRYRGAIYGLGSKKYKDKYGIFKGEEGSVYGVRPRKETPIRIGSAGTWDGFKNPSMFRGIGETLPVDNPNPFGFGNSSSSGLSPETQELFGVRYGERHGRSLVAREKRHSKRSPLAGWYASSRRSFRDELQAARERRLENKGKNPIGGSMSIARLLLTYGLLSSTGILPFNRGGQVPGKGNTDSIPAVLTPEEYVIRKEAVNKVGVDVLDKINNGQIEFHNDGTSKTQAKGPFRKFKVASAQSQEPSQAAQNMGGMDKALIAMTALSFVTQSASDNLGSFGTSLVSTAIQLVALQAGIKESGLKEAFFDMADGALESTKSQRRAVDILWRRGSRTGGKLGGVKSVAGGILAMGQKGVSNLTAGGGLKALTSLGPKLAKIAMPLSLIAGVAGDALASKGKADIAKGQDGTGSIIAGRAASWGAIGATIGSVIPGVGTAVGGGIGATAGAVSGYFEGERLKKEYGVDTGLEKSQATLESFGKKTIDSAGALALLQKDVGKFTKELDSGLSEDYKSKIKAQFTGNLGAIEDVIAKESKKLNTVGEFDAQFKEFAMGLSILTDVPYENIRKGFVDEIEARAKVVASFKVFNDTLLRQAAISKAVGAASISVEQFGFRVERAFDSGSIQDTSINFESVFERISKGQSGDQDISRVLNLLNSTETTGQVGREFQSVAGVLSNLDKAMSVASNVASGDIAGGDIADVIMSQFGDLDERTKASIGNALKDLIPSGGTEADLQATLQSDPTAVREAIANSVSKQMESIKDVTNLYNQQASALLSSVNAILDLNSKYKSASAEINELSFRQQGFDTDRFGDPLSGEAARDRAIAQDRLSLQTASGGMVNPGVNTFRDVLSTSNSRIKDAEFALSNQSLDQQAREQAIATLEKERMARQNAIDGLTELAKDSRQLGVVQDMLAQKQRANAQTYNEGKIMASGTFDDKAQLQRAKKLAQKVAASGTLSGLSDDQRREALGYLEANSDREFVTQSGKINGAQLSKKLIAGDSANASIKDEILGQDSGTKTLEAQAKQLLEIQKKAAAALRDPIVSAYDEIKAEQARLQSDFYNNLTSIFDTYFNSGIDQEIETKQAEIQAVQDQKVRNQRTAQKYGLKESDIIDGSGIAAEGKQYLDRQKEIEKLEAAKKSVNFTGKSLEEQKATARRLAAEVGLDTLQPEKTILNKPGLYAEPAAKANAAAVQSALDVKINALKADQKLSYEELGKTKMGRNFRYSGINEGSIKEIQSISDPSSLTQKEKELNRSVQDLEKRRKKNEPGGTAGTNSGNSGVASTSGNNIPPNPVVPQKPIQDLANAVANIPSEISLGGQYQVNVNVTGLNGNGEFDAAIQRMIQPMINSALQDFTKRNFPEGQLS